MIISLIAALDENDVIGNEQGGLPWRLPAEVRHFRAYCSGKWMLLGRRTFDEMHGWFKDHTPLVLTHHPGTLAIPGRAVDSVEEAVATAQKADAPELVVAGGAEVFALTIPLASRLVLSRIHTHSGGTVKFPPFKADAWHDVSREHHLADEENVHAFTICVLERAPNVRRNSRAGRSACLTSRLAQPPRAPVALRLTTKSPALKTQCLMDGSVPFAMVSGDLLTALGISSQFFQQKQG